MLSVNGDHNLKQKFTQVDLPRSFKLNIYYYNTEVYYREYLLISIVQKQKTECS